MNAIEAHNIMQKYVELILEGHSVARAIITRGSNADFLGTRLIISDSGETHSILADKGLGEEIINNCRDALSQGTSRIISISHEDSILEVFVDVVLQKPSLVILGAGHIGQSLATIGELTGFSITVIDDRSDFANVERFPRADKIIVNDFGKALDKCIIGTNTYIVLVTRGHTHDVECLRQVIGSSAAYIGMIGSRRRVNTVLERLETEGFLKELLDQIYTPIGIDIGAETPEEIAVSIIAEIIKVRRGGKADSMSIRKREDVS